MTWYLKKSTAYVWNHFGFQRSDILQRQVLCKTCRTSVLTSRGNATNLYQHLRKYHRQLYDECMGTKSNDEQTLLQPPRSKQTSITQELESGTSYDKSSRRYNEISDAITRYLAKDMVPINAITKDGFRNLILTLDKRYRIPSRVFFTQSIQKLYDTTRKKVEAELKEVGYYATTTDMWSSRTTEPYQSLTVHFISEDFELKSHCLQTSYFPIDHTGENIASALKDALAAWGLKEEGQSCITTDNAANMIRAMEINGWTRLQCFGHRLHLAIENALKDDRVQRAVGVCKKLVSQFSYSWKKRMALAAAQKELNLTEHSLIKECPTR
ncbi:E3 SUMO-protein ligase ZBED1-like [Triplophysa rosa]|uniref:E3 SUMO-protein ligase ZBED1-like n=1 Tax=Triplophysa rosa TaxID=992332 RepID=UPI002545D602|nr:E3 SUMO-protein ligase ZBED1-like [Triplophysa rosa]